MEGRRLLGGLLLCLLLSSVPADNTLKSLEDLKNLSEQIKDFPRHGLLLLHWFANNVEVNPSGAIELGFEPTHGNYGSCRPSNKISETPPGGQFYSFGDLSQKSSRMFPFYVTEDFHNSDGFPHSNVDRLLIQLKSGSSTRVKKVYLTEDWGQQNQESWRTQMEKAYEISPLLLIEIQELDNDVGCNAKDPRMKFDLSKYLDLQQKAAKALAVYPGAPGLNWFLVLSGYHMDQRMWLFTKNFFCSLTQLIKSDKEECYCKSHSLLSSGHHEVNLVVKSSPKGYARVVWKELPESIARMDIYVGVHKNGATAQPLEVFHLNGRTFGAYNMGVALNPGIQVRLLKKKKYSYLTLWKGLEFDDANGVPPTTFYDFDARLQLFTSDGYAGARMFIKKSFSYWRNFFDYAWVGFYGHDDTKGTKYDTYQWAVRFYYNPKGDCSSVYDVYEYVSNMYTKPGIQARFMLTKKYDQEKARTIPWEQ